MKIYVTIRIFAISMIKLSCGISFIPLSNTLPVNQYYEQSQKNHKRLDPIYPYGLQNNIFNR